MVETGRVALANQLDIEQLLLEAQNRWLSPAEIHEILKNYKKLRIAPEPPNLPGSGSLFLYNRKVLKCFRNDGHKWKKKKNGTKVLEGHERLKVGRIDALHCYYAHGEENESFQRRSCWTIEEELSHIALVHYLEVKGNRTDYNRNKVTEETPCSRENVETIRSFQIEGSTSSNFHPNNCHLPAQTTVYNNQASLLMENIDARFSDPVPFTIGCCMSDMPINTLLPIDDYQGNVPGTNFISLGQADKFKDINNDELTDDLWKNLAWQSWEDLLDACSSGIGSLPKPPSSNNFLLPSQTINTTSLTSAQASEYEDAKSVYNNQASSRFDSSLDLQHPVKENIDAGFADPYYPIPFTNDYQGKFSDVPGTDFSSLSQADKIKDINDAGLTWEDVLENCSSGIGSLPSHPSFLSTQTDTIGDIPKQENEILGQLFTKNWNLVERQELGSHLPAQDWQISRNDSSLLSKWPMDQKLASDSAHNITSRSHEQDIENDRRTELSNTDCGHLLQSDSESNSAIQGKSLFSSSLKQHLFDGSLTEEGLKKADSFNCWMSKELGDVIELHMQSSSGAYWETIENENEVEDSNISPSISQDQLYSIIDFSPNWAYVGSEIKVLITGRFLMSQQEAENNNWSCMFGEVEVPAEILAGGVLRCHTPAQKAGRVPFYVTCSNRLACSELREFEYQENNVRDVHLADNSDSIKSESLHIRFGKLLCLSSIRTPNYDPSKPNEISELSGKISSLLEKDNDDHWDEMLKLTSEEKFSVGKAKEKLVQKLLKEKLHVWLLQKVAGGGKGPSVLDQEGQGVLHFAAALGYDWALEPTVVAGVNINFRDVNGWTALHWAASCGRERTVASLISLGAAAGALSDPTPKYPSGQTPADLASAIGHKGIAGYLAESDLSDLSSHLSCTAINKKDDKASEPSGENPVQTVSLRSAAPITDENLRYGLSMKNSLAAVCKATQAAALIHQVFRVQSFEKKQLKEFGDDTFGMSDERALSLVAVKSHKAGHYDEPVHAAAIRIQNKFRSWKGRKDFLTIRQQIVKIQAHVRGHQVRNNYKKIIWSVGITENSSMIDTSSKEDDDKDFLKEGRKQKEERLQKALARVESTTQHPEARDQYSRLLNVVNEIQETKTASLHNSGVSADFYDDLIDVEALLDDNTFMPTA